MKNEKPPTKIPESHHKEEIQTPPDVIESCERNSALIDTANISIEEKNKLRRRIIYALRKYLKVFSFATVLGASIDFIDYKATRYKVEKYTTNGVTTYAHEDRETTHILNVLAGKESPDSTDTGGAKNSNLQQEEFDLDTYNALWQIEQEYGAPKIRLRKLEDDLDKYDSHKSKYNPFTNTMYIDTQTTDWAINNLISELSHSKQFNSNPINTQMLGILAEVEIVKKYIFNSKGDILINRMRAYETLYGLPNSLENIAHYKIEPEIKNEFKKLTPHRELEYDRKMKFQEKEYEEKSKLVEKEIEPIIKEYNRLKNEAGTKFWKKVKGYTRRDPTYQKAWQEYKSEIDNMTKETQRKTDTIYRKYFEIKR